MRCIRMHSKASDALRSVFDSRKDKMTFSEDIVMKNEQILQYLLKESF